MGLQEPAWVSAKKMDIAAWIAVIRPQQWTKNLLLFAALLFSGQFVQPSLLQKSVLGFFAFSLTASSLYMVNDVIDRKRDRLHLKKKTRPVASGRLQVGPVIIVALFMATLSLSFSYSLGGTFFLAVLFYFSQSLAYSLILKHIFILDVLLISLGFVVRAVAGGLLIGVYISPWLLVCTFLLSLFLALNKRKGELAVKSTIGPHRKVLDHYTQDLLSQWQNGMLAATIVSYCLYALSPGKSELFLVTVPFVVYGLFRFQYLVNQPKYLGDGPDVILLKDVPLWLSILGWGILCAIFALVGS